MAKANALKLSVSPTRKPIFPRTCMIALMVNFIICAGAYAKAVNGSQSRIPAEQPAREIIQKLLRAPTRLQLIGSVKSRRTFFLRIRFQKDSKHAIYSLLVASKSGKIAIVVSGASGMVYAYYSDGLLVDVDTQRPGCLDVLRGVSPSFFFGGREGSRNHQATVAFELLPLLAPKGVAALDLTVPLRSVLARTQTSSFQPTNETAVFQGTTVAVTIHLAPEKSPFAIRSMSMSTAHGGIILSDISPNAEPLQDVFHLTLAKLKASGVPLRVRSYHTGEPVLWAPPPNFGSKQGEIQASVALERLMPINEDREQLMRERWLEKQIAALKEGAASETQPNAGVIPLVRIFAMLEWGPNHSLDIQAIHGPKDPRHPQGLDVRWNFNRAAYHKKLENIWGKAQLRMLTSELVGLMMNKNVGPMRVDLVLDLLSDMGPGPEDHDWADLNGPLTNGKSTTPIRTLFLAMFRARWGLPLTSKEIDTAKQILLNNSKIALYRLRAMEVLCFSGKLPYHPHTIAGLVKTSLDDPSTCLASPTSGRYLYDLSLCRTGRKILLTELTNRNSQLYGQRLLPLAAFNRLYFKPPGYNLAMNAALAIVEKTKYTAEVRREAARALNWAPAPVFKKFALKFLKPAEKHAIWAIRDLAIRKDAGVFMPQLVNLYRHSTTGKQSLIMMFIANGFHKGSDAHAALPLIQMALEQPRWKNKWQGLNTMEMLRFRHCTFGPDSLYPQLLELVQASIINNLPLAVHSLYCFELSTGGKWKIPPDGALADGEPNLLGAGRSWWNVHYAAVRASALRWAVDHPHYPNPAGK